MSAWQTSKAGAAPQWIIFVAASRLKTLILKFHRQWYWGSLSTAFFNRHPLRTLNVACNGRDSICVAHTKHLRAHSFLTASLCVRCPSLISSYFLTFIRPLFHFHVQILWVTFSDPGDGYIWFLCWQNWIIYWSWVGKGCTGRGCIGWGRKYENEKKNNRHRWNHVSTVRGNKTKANTGRCQKIVNWSDVTQGHHQSIFGNQYPIWWICVYENICGWKYTPPCEMWGCVYV